LQECGFSGQEKGLNKKEKQAARSLAARLQLILDAPVSDPEKKEMLKKAGLPLRCRDNLQLMVWNLYQKALGGDLAAIREIRAMLEEAQSGKKGAAVVIVDDME